MSKKFRVIANNNYHLNDIKDSTLGRIPHDGEAFIVDEERLPILRGANDFGIKFIYDDVVAIEEPKAAAAAKDEATCKCGDFDPTEGKKVKKGK